MLISILLLVLLGLLAYWFNGGRDRAIRNRNRAIWDMPKRKVRPLLFHLFV